MRPPLPSNHAAPAGSTPAVAKFCTDCGSEWNALWIRCPVCVSRKKPAGVDRPAGEGRITSAITLYFVLLAASAAAIGLVRFAHAGIGVILLVQLVDAAIVLAWCNVERRDVLPALHNPGTPAAYFIAAGGAAITFTVAALCVAGLRALLGENSENHADPFMQHGYSFAVVILSVCVQPAIIEELAFRGVILQGMRRVLSDNEAILVSAGMFTILHLSVLSFPHLLLIGVTLGVLRVRTGSLYPGMLLHFLHNFACVAQERWFH